MTYQDYLDCAMQYREQADVLERLLKESNQKRIFESAKERAENERNKQLLYSMKNECLKNMLVLECRGREIKRQRSLI